MLYHHRNRSPSFPMTLKCPFCTRTFSKRSAYSQHTSFCLKKVDFSDVSNDETCDADISFEVDNNKNDYNNKNKEYNMV